MRAHLRGYLQHVLDDGVPTLIGFGLGYLSYYVCGLWEPAVAFVVVPGFAIAGWRGVRVVLGVAYRTWPELDFEQDRVRTRLKAMTDDEIAAEEAHWAMMRARHTPKYATEHCPQCGVRSPARCRARMDAEFRFYAVRTERRLRDEADRRLTRLWQRGGDDVAVGTGAWAGDPCSYGTPEDGEATP